MLNPSTDWRSAQWHVIRRQVLAPCCSTSYSYRFKGHKCHMKMIGLSCMWVCKYTVHCTDASFQMFRTMTLKPLQERAAHHPSLTGYLASV